MNTHRQFLIDLITALDGAGFTGIHVTDPEFGSTFLEAVGVEPLVDEILDIDDTVQLCLVVPDTGDACLYLLCCNSPWETVMDMGYSNDATLAAVDAVLNPIAQRYEET